MTFDELLIEFNDYYSKWLNESVIEVKMYLGNILNHLLYLMKKQWKIEWEEN